MQAYSFDAGSGATGDGSLAFSVPVSAGDFLVAVLATDDIRRESGAVTTDDMRFPSGWVVAWMDGASPTGDPRRRRAVAAVATFAASAAGTVAGTVRWPMYGAYALDREMVVLRYSGVKTVVGSAVTALNNQKALYPSVAGTASGHVVRVADVLFSAGYYVSPDTLAGQCVPAGHAQRASLSTGMPASRVVVSDAAVASGGPADTVSGAGAALTNGWGVTLYLGSTFGPSAPTIVEPSGSADLAAAHTISWTPDGTQTAYAVRRRLYSSGTPGAWQWWSGTDWSASSETWIAGAATSLAQAAGLWSSGGAVYDVQVATKGDAARPDGSAYGGVQVVSRQSPTTSSVAVTPLTGATVTSRVPSVAVAGAAGSGASLTGAQVQILDAATSSVLAEGSHGPGGSWTVPLAQALSNGASVLVRGRTVQTGDQPGPWLQVGPYTVTVPTPPTPTVTASTVTHPASGLPGVRLTITTTGGVAARIVRDGTLLGDWPSPGMVQWEDYTLAPGVATSYAVSTLDAASPRNESPATTVTVTLSATGEHAHCWLIDLYDPATAVQVHLVDADDDVMDLRTTVYEPLGRADRIARSMTASTLSGRYTVSADDPATVAGALALLSSGRTLVYRAAVEMHLRTNAQHPGINRPIRPVGQVAISRPANGPWTLRHLTFSWIEQ